MSWEVRHRRSVGLVCTDCGVAYGSWYRDIRSIERDRKNAEKYGCRNCKNKRKVADLPLHHDHRDRHPDWNGSWPCCGANQFGLVGPGICNECGESYPCSFIRAETDQ